jgi:predicted alpha/beta superfamily hydrolase
MTNLNRDRMIHLYLPDDYYESQERYPVMYMYDGHNLFYDQDATYGKSWNLKEFLDHYDKKFIVVGMECNHEGNERLNEYCPYKVNGSFLGDIDGIGDQYMDFVVYELKPYIDKNYRTIPFRECTMIGGSSMGGLMSLYTVVKYNQYFSKAACLSSAIGFCKKEIIQDIYNHPLNSDTKIYLDWGSDESRNKRGLAFSTNLNLEISHLLNVQGASTYPYLIVNGKHNEATWEKQIPIFMNYLWK